MASIAPRVFNAGIGAFMTPKYCGPSSCELGHPSRPSSDRYRRGRGKRGSRRGRRKREPETRRWDATLGHWRGLCMQSHVGGGRGEGAIPDGGFRDELPFIGCSHRSCHDAAFQRVRPVTVIQHQQKRWPESRRSVYTVTTLIFTGLRR